MSDDIKIKTDSSGEGSIITGTGWATRIHKSNDPLSPWFSISDQKTGEKLAQGRGDVNDYLDRLLPSSFKIPK